MPVNGRISSSQATISSFFHSPAKTKTNKRTNSPIHVDLTADSDGEPPMKKTRTSGPRGTPHTSPVAGPSSGAAERWRFTATYPDKQDLHPIKQRTEAELLSQKERQEAFKKKLLLENNRFLSKKTDTVAHIDSDESESEESDHAFKELNEMFSSKAKGKGKSKVSIQAKPSKKPMVVGPSGEAYTPLENQVVVASRIISNQSYIICSSDSTT
jgi:DNA mismatch repair protein MSH3